MLKRYYLAGSSALMFLALVLVSCNSRAQLTSVRIDYDRYDTLRGTNTPYRSWWDVMRYDITVKPDYATQTITGSTTIKFSLKSKPADSMQIDLQQPLIVDKVVLAGNPIAFSRHHNLIMLNTADWLFNEGGVYDIKIEYHGKPRKATRPPWDGGWIWAKDAKGRPWMSVACQGLGASVWYPCKDHQSDEPDKGASLSMIVPQDMMGVGNGRLSSQSTDNGLTTYRWDVLFPINNYNIIPYIGSYTHFGEKIKSEKGMLNCDYWVLDYNKEKAENQFTQVKQMMQCFEYWFGPYPFYADSYKLVESPHLGMEHQSAVAYGNGYMNGYLGRDLSGSGWGAKWDFIIIHESGHEWFGNNITSNDIADMWVHEGFTNYSETLFTECQFGKQAGTDYITGIRKNIQNDRPIVGPYGVNEEGSGDMYYKGANILHTVRTMMQDDAKFRQMLRDMNQQFMHKTVDGEQVIEFIKEYSGFGDKLDVFFKQYLTTTQIPVLEYEISKGNIRYELTNALKNLQMKVYIPTGAQTGEWQWIKAGETYKKQTSLNAEATANAFDKNLYLNTRKVK